MRTCVVAALVMLAGRPTRLAGAAEIPAGTYTMCAQGAHSGSAKFLNGGGFEDGARLVVAQSGSTITATYVDQNGLARSLRFSAAAAAAAAITESGQTIGGLQSTCVAGPGRAANYPAAMSVTGGVMSYQGGMVFVTVAGELRSNAGECGELSQRDATFWIACAEREGGAVRAAAAPTIAAALAAGRYSCATQVETLHRRDGQNEHVSDGATGTLTIAREGTKVTAAYGGDAALSGTLRFSGTGAATASAEGGQSVMSRCVAGGARTAGRVRVEAGVLTTVGAKLVLTVAGTMEAGTCAGARVAASAICSK